MLDLNTAADDRRWLMAPELQRAQLARPPAPDLIAKDLDRIAWNLQRIAAALQKCRKYPD
jgi:hypothetical protein